VSKSDTNTERHEGCPKQTEEKTERGRGTGKGGEEKLGAGSINEKSRNIEGFRVFGEREMREKSDPWAETGNFKTLSKCP